MDTDKIKIHCTDNDKFVEAVVVDKTDGWLLTNIQPGNLRLQLRKTQPGIYVGNMLGREFVYKDE